MAANQFSLKCDFGHILLMEANGDLSPLDIPALNHLLQLCISNDLPAIRSLAIPTNRSRSASAARFILRKHDFNIARETSIREAKEQAAAQQANQQRHSPWQIIPSNWVGAEA